MSFNPELRIPWGYQRSTKTLAEARTILLVHYHPEYVRRLLAWLSSKEGKIGIGGTWRATGTQPVAPGFAPEGRSFHQDQRYADGVVGATAVDLVAPNGTNVHRAPNWSEVPAQGSAEAKRWGVHCNISTEAWHMQPVEIDGWQSWFNGGRPAPRVGYPIPEPPQPNTPPKEDVVADNQPLLLNNKILDELDSVPPVALFDVDPPDPSVSRWFQACVIAGMFKFLTGSKLYTQEAGEKLAEFLKD